MKREVQLNTTTGVGFIEVPEILEDTIMFGDALLYYCEATNTIHIAKRYKSKMEVYTFMHNDSKFIVDLHSENIIIQR